MKQLEYLIKSIERENFHVSKRELFPIDTFFEKTYISVKLLQSAQRQFNRLKKGHKKNTLIKEARKNFVINCVTAIEVYFKDIVRISPELNNEILSNNSVGELLEKKEKVNLWEAYQIFKEKKFRIGDILLYYYTFQNLEDINIVMSKLLLIPSFITDVEKYVFILNKENQLLFEKSQLCLSVDYPDWKLRITEFFNLRHDYVHHINFNDKLGEEKLKSYFYLMQAFILITDEYYFSKIDIKE